jgi:hypothetical protein
MDRNAQRTLLDVDVTTIVVLGAFARAYHTVDEGKLADAAGKLGRSASCAP